MTWGLHHRDSEQFANEAEYASHNGSIERAWSLYQKAAEAEQRSIEFLNPSTQMRTLGICVVSAAALWYKANQPEIAERFIQHWLDKGGIPMFCVESLRNIRNGRGESQIDGRK